MNLICFGKFVSETNLCFLGEWLAIGVVIKGAGHGRDKTKN